MQKPISQYSNVKYDPNDPSTYKTYTQRELSNVASHEFGHLLGLGDAYGEKGYRYAAPEYYILQDGSILWIPSDNKMRSSQGNVSDIDIMFMLKAWEMNIFQPFPETSSYQFSPGSTSTQ